jgi:hypothetical protein
MDGLLITENYDVVNVQNLRRRNRDSQLRQDAIAVQYMDKFFL